MRCIPFKFLHNLYEPAVPDHRHRHQHQQRVQYVNTVNSGCSPFVNSLLDCVVRRVDGRKTGYNRCLYELAMTVDCRE